MRVLVLGATGSIGQQTIAVIKKNKYQLVGIGFYHNFKKALKIKTKYRYSPIDKLHSDVSSYDELIEKTKPDIVVNAIVGFAGLFPTITTIKHHKNLCLANKESMVVAGQFITKLAQQNHVKIFPIDSEHAALFQIINQNNEYFEKLYITASGGPFYKTPKHLLTKVSIEQATNHPTWKMGAKISVDSATLLNKCFEIIEAYWYFRTTNIEALYHPQSLVHGIVEYKHKKVMFVSKPDMRLSIFLALNAFRGKSKHVLPFSTKYQLLKIDKNEWEPLKWATEVLKKPKSSLPIIINAANEEAVNLFLNNLITFDEITKLIKRTMIHFKTKEVKQLADVFLIDKKVRAYIKNNSITPLI